MKNNKANKFFQHEYFFVLLVISINIIIGLFIVTDYGISTDEHVNWDFGTETLDRYIGKEKNAPLNFGYGGGFLVPAKIGSLILSSVFPNWIEPYSWHFVYFLFFQLSLFFLYLLARKFMGKWAANVTVLLYATQPLLWGHAFMNAKDTPFLAILLGALVLGVSLADNLKEYNDRNLSYKENIKEEFALDTKNQIRRNLLIKAAIVSVSFGAFLFVIFGREIIHGWITNLITFLYMAHPSSTVGTIFSSIAQNAHSIALENYINQALLIYDQTISRLSFVAIFILFPACFYWLFPLTFKQALRNVRKMMRTKGIIPAALLLGMCVSTRTIGIAAIGVVGFYWLYRNGRQSMPILSFYLLLAGIIAYILWPGLWSVPLKTYGEIFINAFAFEKWNGNILFEGELYNKTNYPNHMLPKLIALQLTEPVLILGVLGMGIAGLKVWRKEVDGVLTAIIAGWFVGPVILAVMMHPVIYNGFRHFLFILPPIFIFSGIGLDYIYEKLKGVSWRILLALLILLPGILGMFRLHPYEYVYFNSFAGGEKGAFRQYELDYWLLSYREAIEYLNENASPNSRVSIHLGEELVTEFARADLHLRGRIRTLTPKGIDYLIVTTNNNIDLEMENHFPNIKQIHAIERGGAPLAIVYQFIE